MSWNSPLPWTREDTYVSSGAAADAALIVDATNKLPTQYTGREFIVEDTVHNTGASVTLKAVRNHSATALTINNRLVYYKTGAGDYGHNIGLAAAVGAQAFPIDDALVAAKNGQSIQPGDIFYIVTHGPCDIDASSAANSTGLAVITIGAMVQSDASAMIGYTAATTADYIVGKMAEAAVTAGYPYNVIVGEPRKFY